MKKILVCLLFCALTGCTITGGSPREKEKGPYAQQLKKEADNARECRKCGERTCVHIKFGD